MSDMGISIGPDDAERVAKELEGIVDESVAVSGQLPTELVAREIYERSQHKRENAMSNAIWIIVLAWIVFTVLDVSLYIATVSRHGPQWNSWPGSGFYVWWIHR